jgi:tRNA-Thr(GGU) m(6)t(6)A37 methyltransferase TsaA
VSFTFAPIGVVRSPFTEKVAAPRQAQAQAARGVEATIELFPGHGYEEALSDLATWERIWVVFVFDRVTNWRPKVLPPRSARRRGLFATRSPHRPNPIGLSAVRLVGVEGLVVRVQDIDILDGTPVLDLKPYVPYADAFPDAGSGWLEAPRDPVPSHEVAWSERAAAQRDWLAARGLDVGEQVARALALGVTPSAYRRIRKVDGGLELAIKEWRARFRVEGAGARVESLVSGYRPRELATGDDPALDVHRAFVAAFAPR